MIREPREERADHDTATERAGLEMTAFVARQVEGREGRDRFGP